jgi:hypothetical protein
MPNQRVTRLIFTFQISDSRISDFSKIPGEISRPAPNERMDEVGFSSVERQPPPESPGGLQELNQLIRIF